MTATKFMICNSINMMYVEKTKDLEVNLMGMSWEEAIALKTVIEGAGFHERHMFNRVLHQLNSL